MPNRIIALSWADAAASMVRMSAASNIFGPLPFRSIRSTRLDGRLNIEPYLIGSAINATLAQRLVRRICDHCKIKEAADPTMADHLALQGIAADELMVGKGCDRCRNTGFSGRVGLYEVLVLDDHVRDLIVGNPNVNEFRRLCIERGMVTLRQDGFGKVAAGSTTVDEVLRVTESTI